MQGAVNETSRRERHRKRRENNINDWTGLAFGESVRAVEDRVGLRRTIIL